MAKNHGPVMEDPVVPFERNLYGHPLAGLLWERQFGENPIEVRLGEGFPIGNAYLCTVKKGLFLSVYVDDINLAGKKQHIDPIVYLDYTQRQCEIRKRHF